MGKKSNKKFISGTNGDDVLDGNDQNNKIFGHGGDDVLNGYGGNDYLHGGRGDDVMSGGDGNDLLHGGRGNDDMSGGDGNDHLDGHAGNDTLSGGDGNDTLHGYSGDDHLSGGDGNDHLDGHSGDDTLVGEDGNDILHGHSGNDQISGGAGNDKLRGHNGEDVLLGGDGNDRLIGNRGDDQLSGGAGHDYIHGGKGDDTIIWNAGDGIDTINGGKGNDTLSLTTSDNVSQVVQLSTNNKGELEVTIDGDEGTELTLKNIENLDLQFGQAGGSIDLGNVEGPISDDPIDLSGGEGGDVIDAGGSDQAVNVDAGTGDDTVTGGNAADTISGGEGSDVITGGGGDDVIDAGVGDDQVLWKAGDGNDSINGGEGFDELDLTLDETQPSEMTISADANGNVILQQPDGTQLVVDGVEDIVINAGAGGTTLVIGDLTGTDIAQDTLYFVGGAGVDSLDASGTDRRINAQGKDGNDELRSGSGNDTLDGGAGNDLLDAGSGQGVDTILGGSGDDTIIATLGDEQGSNAIDIVDGGADNDQLQVHFVEPTPHDLLLRVTSNGDGSLTITSEDIDVDEELHVSNVENLQIVAGEGALNFVVGALGDTTLTNGVDFEGSSDADAFDASQTDVVTRQYGHDGGDNLIGGSQNDELHGGADNDSLSGGQGDDVLNGGTGNDVMDGGQGVDQADYSDASAAVTVDLNSFTSQDTLGAGSDTLVNIENIVGSDFDDVLIGNGQDNVLSGGLGNDDLTGGAGFDVIFGGEGDDTLSDADSGVLSGDAGDDVINGFAAYFNDPSAVLVNLSASDVDMNGTNVAAGTAKDGYGDTDTLNTDGVVLSAHDDVFLGSDNDNTVLDRAGSDDIATAGGDDFIIMGSGDDTIDGGAGTDFVSFQDDGLDSAGPASQGVVVDLAAGTALDGFGDSDSISNVENVLGSELNDTITGDAGDNVVLGRGGDDIVSGGAGNDTVGGWTGNDTLDGGAGDDLMVGGEGADTMTGGTGADTYQFMTNGNTDFGQDTITDFDVAEDILDLSPFEIGNIADVQSIASESGGDTTLTIDGARSITLVGVTIAQLGAANFVFADVQNPTTGTENDDVLTGTGDADVLLGLEGNDSLEGLAGDDTLDGGDGFDQANYMNDPAAVNVDLATGTATDGYADTDTLIDIENVQGSEFGDVLTGDDGDNVFWGNGGDDTFSGAGGNDSLVAGAGLDSGDGGAGLDVVYHSSDGIPFGAFGAQPGLTITFNGDGSITSTNLVNSDVETFTNIEGVTGSIGADVITGDANDNFIQGFFGQNIIDGGAGSDTVFFNVNLGRNIEVNLDQGYSLIPGEPWFGTDSLTSIENVVGSPAHDAITGDAGDNILEGVDGDDVINGRAGDDFINGGQSTLMPYFGNEDESLDGFDVVSYVDDPGSVTVNLTLNTATDGWGDIDTLNSIEGVIGSASADTLVGNDQDNFFEGGGGDDVLTGGAGADYYQVSDDGNNVANFGNDTITDYEVGVDQIDVTQFHNVQSVGDLSITQDGADALVTLEAGHSVRLVGVDSSLLTDADFVFVQNQSIDGTPDGDTLEGGDGNDLINGLAGNDNLFGNAGADFINGGEGSDFIDGGADNDTLNGGSDLEYDHINGGDGDDIINAGPGGSTLEGGPGDDTLTGSVNDWDNLFGQEGDDTLIDPDGSGLLNGGPGNDTIDGNPSYEQDPAGVFINLDTSSWDVFGDSSVVLASRTAIDGYGDTDTILGDVSHGSIHGSQFDDYIQGSDFSQFIPLRAGNDTAFGMGGDDNLSGGSGDDYLDGGDGFDNADYYDDGYDPAGPITQGVVANISTVDFDYGGGIALANQAIDGWGNTDALINIDQVHGSAMDDVLIGSSGHNWLVGSEGNDLLFGGDDGDNLVGGEGDDLLDGQLGEWDTAWYHFEGGTQGVTVDLSLGTATDSFGGSDTLVSIENVEGTEFDDVITGDANRNHLSGNEGNDVLYGGGGDDNFTDRDGNDQSFGETGHDWFDASSGDDLIDGGADYDTVNYRSYTGTTSGVSVDLENIVDAGGYTSVVTTPDGFGGTDYLRDIENVNGTDHDDFIAGDADDNRLEGRAGADTLTGRDGNDWLHGGDENDVIDGGAGDDFITGGENDDILTGGPGRDQFQFDGFTNEGNPTSFGQDVITDFDINTDVLDLHRVPEFTNLQALNAVQQGADVLISFVSSPNGVPETNSVLIQNILVSDLENMEIWYAPIEGTSGDDVLNGTPFDDIINGYEGNDTLNGLAGHDNLDGGEGDDVLNGGDTYDNLFGGPGNDTLNGGADDDWAIYRWSGATEGVVVDLGSGVTTNDGHGGTDTLISIENIEGSELGDVITGDAGDNGFNGREGDDVIHGGDGNDWFNGDAGNDQLFGEGGFDSFNSDPGDDLFDGGADIDHVNYDAWTGTTSGVTVDLSDVVASAGGYSNVVVANDGHGGTDYLRNIENLSGSDFDDNFTGDAGDNSFSGNAGNDVLSGGAGHDWLDGGPGDDTVSGGMDDDALLASEGVDDLDGGAGWDNLQFDNWTGTNQGVVLDMGAGTVSNDGFGNSGTIANIEGISGSDFDDALTGDGQDNHLVGNAGDDVITGGAGDDHLEGGDGNDTLVSSAGNDFMHGGAGDDTFVLSDGASVDIGDFATGAGSEDVIDFSSIVAINDMASLMAAATDDGSGNVNIDIGGGFNLHLSNVNTADFHSDDFMF